MAAIVSDTTVTLPDGSTVRTVTYADGVIERSFGFPPGSRPANMQALVDKAGQALAANSAFLAIATPTAAQNATQIQRLTRETTAIIRLLLGLTDTTDGT
jgi:hypothetical protein